MVVAGSASAASSAARRRSFSAAERWGRPRCRRPAARSGRRPVPSPAPAWASSSEAVGKFSLAGPRVGGPAARGWLMARRRPDRHGPFHAAGRPRSRRSTEAHWMASATITAAGCSGTVQSRFAHPPGDGEGACRRWRTGRPGREVTATAARATHAPGQQQRPHRQPDGVAMPSCAFLRKPRHASAKPRYIRQAGKGSNRPRSPCGGQGCACGGPAPGRRAADAAAPHGRRPRDRRRPPPAAAGRWQRQSRAGA